MNNNTSTPQSVTLQTAVLMTIKEFAKQLTPFSAHEITKQIRQAVSDATLEIPETEVHGASYRFDIPHTKVKDLFAELWRNGLFDSEFSLSRKFNGMYYEYTPSPVQSAVQSASTSVPQAPTTSVPVVQVLSSSNGKVNKADVTSRIAKYL